MPALSPTWLLGPCLLPRPSFCSFISVQAQLVQLRVGLDLTLQQGRSASECGGDLIKRAPACLRHFEVGEADESHQEASKDEEDKMAAQIL